jgi:hypothetical protein
MIMYTCAVCYDHCSEACCRVDRNELRVLPNGQWVCEGCFDETPNEIFGLPADYDGDRPRWSDFKAPPEHVPAATN